MSIDFGEFGGEIFSVGGSAVEFERLSSLRSVSDGLVESLEDGSVGGFEFRSPVEGTTSSSGRTG